MADETNIYIKILVMKSKAVILAYLSSQKVIVAIKFSA